MNESITSPVELRHSALQRFRSGVKTAAPFASGVLAVLVALLLYKMTHTWSKTTDCERYQQHSLDHIRRVCGADCVGIGSDFDGISTTPVGLEDVSKFPDLLAELLRRGWSDGDVRKVAGENVLRVMRRVEGVARETGRR